MFIVLNVGVSSMQETKSKLVIDWCSYEAAKWAVEHWHYSGTMPVGKTVKVGVWEDDVYIGCVIFSRGANNNMGKMFNLKQDRVCELTRVALNNHKHFVSEILAKAINFLKQNSPDMKLIISYADSEQKHKGGIYQATNWLYLGKTKGSKEFIFNGKRHHAKTVHSNYGRGSQNVEWLRKHVDPEAKEYHTLGKHKYIFPLNKKARKKLLPFTKEYPNTYDGGEYVDENAYVDLSDT